MKKTILLIDDDTKLLSLLKDYFVQNGFDVYAATEPDEGIRLMRLHRPHLLTLDVMLPGKTGFDVCREIRHESDVPVVMLTARGEVTDRIVGLEIGADDYLPKPFEPRELLARIQSILRRTEERLRTKNLVFGDLDINPQARSVKLKGETVELSTMEFEALELFARNPGRVLSRDELLSSLRGLDWETFDRSIDVLISRLRHKLGDDPKAPHYFRTVRGKGYLFMVPEEGDKS